MKKLVFPLSIIIASALFISSCGLIGGTKNNKNTGSSISGDGQLHGTSLASTMTNTRPFGMVYVYPGAFQMGPSDQDINYSYTARNKTVTISGFWMDATEITNNEYRSFTNWVRDSIGAKLMGYVKQGSDGVEYVDWNRASTIKWGDKSVIEKVDAIILPPDDRIFGKKELDVSKIMYQSEVFDYKSAAQNRDVTVRRSAFILKSNIPVYPDTICWIRDFSYGYNEPMAKNYFSHPAYGEYPVVGVNWKQANAFCQWRTQIRNAYLLSKRMSPDPDFRLPSEAQWEYAARGGSSQSSYPWGGPYLRNKKGCLLANFKNGRGNYAETPCSAKGVFQMKDTKGIYTVKAQSFWPNKFQLYNMAGNVAEWTSSLYYEGAYNFQSEINPDIRWNAKESDPPRMKRKVVRGGSWKDVAYYLQTSTRTYEYQDSAKSHIGFRCVQDLPPYGIK